MFSNEEVRQAMGELVKRKGENHTALGRYADEMGVGHCFLGALVEQMTGRVPAEGTSAAQVFGGGNVTTKMEVALAVAQYLNDQQIEWKYVLVGVDYVLAADDAKVALSPCGLTGCNCSRTYSTAGGEAVQYAKSVRALDKAKERAERPAQSLPEVVKPVVKPAIPSFDELTKSMSTFSAAMATLSVDMSKPVKKDHTLAA